MHLAAAKLVADISPPKQPRCTITVALQRPPSPESSSSCYVHYTDLTTVSEVLLRPNMRCKLQWRSSPSGYVLELLDRLLQIVLKKSVGEFEIGFPSVHPTNDRKVSNATYALRL